MNINEFKNYVRDAREKHLVKTEVLVGNAFSNSEYENKSPEYFRSNASAILTELRKFTWKIYQENERKFSEEMLMHIAPGSIKEMNGEEAVKYYVTSCAEHIYSLQLSNTQSRRSRAGNEFELILELILKHSDIPCQTQGEIGNQFYSNHGLGKLVDIVIPSAEAYEKNKRNAILLSSKTILRERWQEVTDEVKRTGAREIFLATIDDKVTNSTVNKLNEENITLVVPAKLKQEKYSSNDYIISLETFLNMAWELTNNC